jgi:hypothetical protein
LGGRQLPVTGRTYRKIADFENYWLSLCLCPNGSLFQLIGHCPHLATKSFISEWLKSFRRHFFAKAPLLKATLASRSILGLRFEIWQCCQDSLTLDQVDDLLDEMTQKELQNFSADFDRKLDLASGTSPDVRISELLRVTVRAAENPNHTPESMLANLVKHKVAGSYEEWMNSTPAQLGGLLSDPERLEDDLAWEAITPEKGPEAKSNQRSYDECAEEILKRLGLSEPKSD